MDFVYQVKYRDGMVVELNKGDGAYITIANLYNNMVVRVADKMNIEKISRIRNGHIEVWDVEIQRKLNAEAKISYDNIACRKRHIRKDLQQNIIDGLRKLNKIFESFADYEIYDAVIEDGKIKVTAIEWNDWRGFGNVYLTDNIELFDKSISLEIELRPNQEKMPINSIVSMFGLITANVIETLLSHKEELSQCLK